MKLRTLVIVFGVLSVAFSSCTKEAGPAGADGNANVKSFVFNAPNLGATFWSDTLKGVSYPSLENSLLLTYIKDEDCINNWFSVPGIGCLNRYMVQVFTYPMLDTSNTGLSMQLRDPDGSPYTGTAITFTKVRVIVAPANSNWAGKKEMDYTNYSSACRYFNIAE